MRALPTRPGARCCLTRAVWLATVVQCVTGGLGVDTDSTQTATAVETTRSRLELARLCIPGARQIGLVFSSFGGREEVLPVLPGLSASWSEGDRQVHALIAQQPPAGSLRGRRSRSSYRNQRKPVTLGQCCAKPSQLDLRQRCTTPHAARWPPPAGIAADDCQRPLRGCRRATGSPRDLAANAEPERGARGGHRPPCWTDLSLNPQRESTVSPPELRQVAGLRDPVR